MAFYKFKKDYFIWVQCNWSISSIITWLRGIFARNYRGCPWPADGGMYKVTTPGVKKWNASQWKTHASHSLHASVDLVHWNYVLKLVTYTYKNSLIYTYGDWAALSGRTSLCRTTNYSGVVAVTPSRPWSIPRSKGLYVMYQVHIPLIFNPVIVDSVKLSARE